MILIDGVRSVVLVGGDRVGAAVAGIRRYAIRNTVAASSGRAGCSIRMFAFARRSIAAAALLQDFVTTSTSVTRPYHAGEPSCMYWATPTSNASRAAMTRRQTYDRRSRRASARS